MVWLIILAWVVLVAALVVFVLRLAKGESHHQSFTQAMDERSRRKERKSEREREPDESEQQRQPRVAGTAPAFTPQGHNLPLRRAHPYRDPEDTMENPVYINESSVVEVRALGTYPGESAEPTQEAAQVSDQEHSEEQAAQGSLRE
ncbi:hypothetical protein KIM372_17170 [Bombiscardovia nodaiensis]|uniref:Uncharacterized protein n=1 Tax=Bombiscardovia nodaiensis TaxID=2932181 RepID=A0ABN6SGU4_9BIFI|nr:hypothetical protein KIM372_17170 [Bombiscardovia nodaiensis]